MSKEKLTNVIRKIEEGADTITNIILISGDNCEYFTVTNDLTKTEPFSAKFSKWHSTVDKPYKEISVYLHTVKNENNSIDWYSNIISNNKVRGILKGNVSSADRSKFEPLVFEEILSFIKSNDSKEHDLFITFKQNFVSEYISKMINQNIRFYVQKADFRKKDSNEEIKNANEWRKFGEVYSEFFRVKIEQVPDNDPNLLELSNKVMSVKN